MRFSDQLNHKYHYDITTVELYDMLFVSVGHSNDVVPLPDTNDRFRIPLFYCHQPLYNRWLRIWTVSVVWGKCNDSDTANDNENDFFLYLVTKHI